MTEKEKIQKQIGKFAILINKHIESPEFNVWHKETIRILVSIFWDNSYQASDFRSIDYTLSVIWYNTPDSAFQLRYLQWLQESKLLLESFLDELDDVAITTQISYDFWPLIDPKIVSVSRKLFDDWHYASSVFEATKFINNEIKWLVKDKTGQEFDGTDLMNRAFSLSDPIILLWDLSNETGRNTQKWYMDIYRWTISAIRNPKWHENIQIDQKKAIHFLFLANLLLLKISDTVN